MADEMLKFITVGSQMVIADNLKNIIKDCATRGRDEKAEYGGLILAFKLPERDKLVYLAFTQAESMGNAAAFKRVTESLSIDDMVEFAKANRYIEDSESMFYAGEFHTHVRNCLPSEQDLSFFDINPEAIQILGTVEEYVILQKHPGPISRKYPKMGPGSLAKTPGGNFVHVSLPRDYSREYRPIEKANNLLVVGVATVAAEVNTKESPDEEQEDTDDTEISDESGEGPVCPD